MYDSWPPVGFLGIGFTFFLYGAFVVYSDRFYDYMFTTFWNPRGEERYMIFNQNVYDYSYLRYTNGMGSMLLGLWWLLLPIFPEDFAGRTNFQVFLIPMGVGFVLFGLREWNLSHYPHSRLKYYLLAGPLMIVLGLVNLPLNIFDFSVVSN